MRAVGAILGRAPASNATVYIAWQPGICRLVAGGEDSYGVSAGEVVSQGFFPAISASLGSLTSGPLVSSSAECSTALRPPKLEARDPRKDGSWPQRMP